MEVRQRAVSDPQAKSQRLALRKAVAHRSHMPLRKHGLRVTTGSFLAHSPEPPTVDCSATVA